MKTLRKNAIHQKIKSARDLLYIIFDAILLISSHLLEMLAQKKQMRLSAVNIIFAVVVACLGVVVGC